MKTSNPPSNVDPKNGYCQETKTFHSLRPFVHLPAQTIPLSASSYALSLQFNSRFPTDAAALINSATGCRLSYSQFASRVKTLAIHLQTSIGLSKNDTAFVLAPNSTRIPLLYFSLLSLGVVISPANSVSTELEISRQINLSKPTIAFATSTTSHKLLPNLKRGTILIDSPEFESMMTAIPACELSPVEVHQSDVAAIMFSSGTTGLVKGVMLTHLNLIAIVGIYYALRQQRSSPAVMLYTVPYFHIFGFFYSLKSLALNETVVLLERFDRRNMLRAVEDYGVTHLAVAPPVVVAMVEGGHVTKSFNFDLSSLEEVRCGGAPLGKDVIKAFTKSLFPHIMVFYF